MRHFWIESVIATLESWLRTCWVFVNHSWLKHGNPTVTQHTWTRPEHARVHSRLRYEVFSENGYFEKRRGRQKGEGGEAGRGCEKEEKRDKGRELEIYWQRDFVPIRVRRFPSPTVSILSCLSSLCFYHFLFPCSLNGLPFIHCFIFFLAVSLTKE